MHCTKTALGRVSLTPELCFVPGKVVHMQFDSGSQEGHAMGRFIIPDVDGMEIIQAGQYYGAG